jgi:hypothetical protein
MHRENGRLIVYYIVFFFIVSASCPSGQWQYGESCYKVVDTLNDTWTNARAACSSQGGRLAVFDARKKMQFIINLFRSGEHYFVKYLKVRLALKHSACCSVSSFSHVQVKRRH